MESLATYTREELVEELLSRCDGVGVVAFWDRDTRDHSEWQFIRVKGHALELVGLVNLLSFQFASAVEGISGVEEDE